jgi:cytochrome c-type biogenesis protein CcmE
MTPRQKRMLIVAGIIIGVGAASALALQALRENVSLFYDPSEVVAGQAPADRVFRVGGMVVEGSRQRAPGSLEERFQLTDFQHTVTVSYSKVLPDLFREGQGVVARGKMNAEGVFVAEEVLAKHDEKYMPPEVKDSLKKHPPPAEPGPRGGQ